MYGHLIKNVETLFSCKDGNNNVETLFNCKDGIGSMTKTVIRPQKVSRSSCRIESALDVVDSTISLRNTFRTPLKYVVNVHEFHLKVRYCLSIIIV